jgi:hypothetical protein
MDNAGYPSGETVEVGSTATIIGMLERGSDLSFLPYFAVGVVLHRASATNCASRGFGSRVPSGLPVPAPT